MAVALTGIDYIKDRLNRKDLFNDYQELTRILYEENLELKNSSFSANHDITDKSYKAAARSDNERGGTTRNYKKTTYFGVVVGIASGGIWGLFNKVYYVDVPLWNKKLIDHPETFESNYITDEVKLKQFEDLIFADRTPGIFQQPAVGEIVEVNLPQNYPNHIPTNKSECYITNIIGKAVNGRKDAPRNPAGGGGGGIFEAENRDGGGGAAPAGGAPGAGAAFAQLPDWAVTKQNPGLGQYSAQELKQINDASKSIPEITQRMSQYMSKIASICKEFKVDPRLICAIVAVESKFQHPIQNKGGAGGLMQLTEVAITDSLTTGRIQDKPKVKQIIGNTSLLTKIKKNGKQVNWATSNIIKLAKTNLELNIWIGVDNFNRWQNKANSWGDPTNLKAAGAYNGGAGKYSIKNKKTGVVTTNDTTGVPTFDFSRIRGETQNYIFRFNAFLKLLPTSQGAPPTT